MRTPTDVTCVVVVAAAALGYMVWTPPAAAGRVVQFEILVNGKVVLEAQGLDEGGPPDDVWRHLKGLEFRPAKGFTVPADPGDPLRATLKGKVRLFARYGGDVEVTALALVRGKKDDGGWRLDPEEVERTFKIRKVDPEARTRDR